MGSFEWSTIPESANGEGECIHISAGHTVFTRQEVMSSHLNVYGYLLLTVYTAFRRLLMKRMCWENTSVGKLFHNSSLLMLLHLSPAHLVQSHCQRQKTKGTETLIPCKTAHALNSFDKSCLLVSTKEWLLFCSSSTYEQNLWEKGAESKNQMYVSLLINRNRMKVYTLFKHISRQTC